jgi:hypothetical protein
MTYDHKNIYTYTKNPPVIFISFGTNMNRNQEKRLRITTEAQ